MDRKHVFYGYVKVFDEKVYTEDKADDFALSLLDAYHDIYELLKSQIDPASNVSFSVNASLVNEVVVDAIIGLRKIKDSENNEVKEPNAFKVAAYLSYWWLRHKPVSLPHPPGGKLEDARLLDDLLVGKSDKEKEELTNVLHWKLKHINELVAVQFAITYIFDINTEVCNQKQVNRVKKKQGEKFPYCTFTDMQTEMSDKLLYYFAYRALAPKVIEQILEAYTFHPSWGLTGNLINGDGDDEESDINE